MSARCVWTSPRVWSRWPYGLGLAMFPRFYPHHFALRWSHFTLSILLLLLQARTKGFSCSVLSVLWISMWTAPDIGGNLPSCWYVLVLDAVGLAHQSTEFLTGWGTLFCWLMRCVVFLHLSVLGRILLGAWLTSQAIFRGVPLEDICVAAWWSSPHTFIRFYNFDLDTAPGSQVLSAWTSHVCCLVCNRFVINI